MAVPKNVRADDSDVLAILKLLESAYMPSHAGAKIKSYRQNSASIRIRIIDLSFQGKDRGERHEQVWRLLEQLPEDVQSQITVLLLLTPEEAKTSIANMDFNNPIPSRL